MINGGKVLVGVFIAGGASTRSELELLLELVLASLAAGSDLIRALSEKLVFLCLPPGVRSSRTAVKMSNQRCAYSSPETNNIMIPCTVKY